MRSSVVTASTSHFHALSCTVEEERVNALPSGTILAIKIPMSRSVLIFFFFSSRRRHTRFKCDWSSDVCSSDLGGFWGHLTYIDHGPNGFKVKGTGVTSYEVTGPTSRRIKGTAEVDGVGGYTYIVDVTDNGEPGRNDTFAITLSNTYSASGFLAGGNIKLHGEPSPCL